MRVAADTGPLRYLLAIGHIDILPQLHADLILIDDRKGVTIAAQKGFEVTGTLGLLIRASRLGIPGFPSALERLKETNFPLSSRTPRRSPRQT